MSSKHYKHHDPSYRLAKLYSYHNLGKSTHFHASKDCHTDSSTTLQINDGMDSMPVSTAQMVMDPKTVPCSENAALADTTSVSPVSYEDPDANTDAALNLDTFTCFGQLPLELRLTIWKMASHIRRFIDLWPIEVEGYREKVWSEHGTLSGDPPIMWCSTNYMPGILQACRESREMASKFYELAFRTCVEIDFKFHSSSQEPPPATMGFCIRPRIYINWDVDIICPLIVGDLLKRQNLLFVGMEWIVYLIPSHPKMKRLAIVADYSWQVSPLISRAFLEELFIYPPLPAQKFARSFRPHFRLRDIDPSRADDLEASEFCLERIDAENKLIKNGDYLKNRNEESPDDKSYGLCALCLQERGLYHKNRKDWKPPKITASIMEFEECKI